MPEEHWGAEGAWSAGRSWGNGESWASWAPWGRGGPWSTEEADERWTIDRPQILDVDDVTSCRIMIVGGRVDVIAHESTGAQIEVSELRGEGLEVTTHEGTLVIKTPSVGWENLFKKLKMFASNDSVVVSVAVPRGIPVMVSTVSADGLISEAAGKVSVNTVSGNLVVDDTRGDLRINTVSGEIAVRAHQGSLRANSVSGEITASGALDDVRATSVGGDLTFDTASPSGSLSANAVSGGLMIRIPERSGLKVKANSTSGRVFIDGRDHGRGSQKIDLDGGPGESGDVFSVTANTVSGELTILRSAQGSDR